jgi:hypothetical protein
MLIPLYGTLVGILGDLQGNIYIFDVLTGTMRAKIQIGDEIRSSPTTITLNDGSILGIVGSNDHNIYIFDIDQYPTLSTFYIVEIII